MAVLRHGFEDSRFPGIQIGKLAESFIDMQRTLQRYLKDLERNHQFIRDTFGRYVSEEIVDSILAQPNGLHLGGKLVVEIDHRMAQTETFDRLRDVRGLVREVRRTDEGRVDVAPRERACIEEISRGVELGRVGSELHQDRAVCTGGVLVPVDGHCRPGELAAVIAGDEELSRNVCQVKDLEARTSVEVSLENSPDVVAAIQQILTRDEA